MIGHCLVVARGGGVSSTVGVDDRPLPCGGEGGWRVVHGRGGSSATARWWRGRWRVVHGRGWMIGHCPVVARGGGVSSTVGVDHRPLPGGGGGGGVSSTVEVGHRPLPGGGGGGGVSSTVEGDHRPLPPASGG